MGAIWATFLNQPFNRPSWGHSMAWVRSKRRRKWEHRSKECQSLSNYEPQNITMKTNPAAELQKPAFIIRVHSADGTVESFAARHKAESKKIWESVDLSRLFTC